MPTRSELNRAAAEVIGILKGITDYSNAKVAVIGGLALWNYVQNGRTTEDVDFIVNIDTAPNSVKQKLLNLPNSPFIQQAQYFYYKTPSGSYIQIDITPGWQSPYMPSAAQRLGQIPAGTVPYISQTDLVVFKINSCGLRAQGSKKRTDAADAVALLENMTSPLRLTSEQQAIVEPCISDVVTHGTKTADWWRQHLGLAAQQAPARQSPPRQAPATEYWTWSEQYQNHYHRHSDGTYEWASQAGSSTGQQLDSRNDGRSRGRGRR